MKVGKVRWNAAISPLCRAANQPELPPVRPGISLLDLFGEEIAEHGDIERASAAIRVPLGVGQSLYERLCRNIGDQSR